MHKGCTNLEQAKEFLVRKRISESDIKVYVDRKSPISLKEFMNTEESHNTNVTNQKSQKQRMAEAVSFSDTESDKSNGESSSEADNVTEKIDVNSGPVTKDVCGSEKLKPSNTDEIGTAETSPDINRPSEDK